MRRCLVLAVLVVFTAGTGCAGSGGSSLRDVQGTPFAPESSTPTLGTGGLAELPGEEILRRSTEALLAARSVHIRGGDDEQRLDMRIGAGDAAAGAITIEGHVLSLTRLGQSLWLRGDAGLWEVMGLGEYGRVLAGRYVKFPAGSGNLDWLARWTDLPGLVTALLDPNGGVVTKTPVRRVGATPAIGLVLAGQDRQAVYVALSGPPLPLELVPRYPATDRYELIDYDKPISVHAPPSNQVIDSTAISD